MYDFVNQTYALDSKNQAYIDQAKSLVKEVTEFRVQNTSLRGASGAIFGVLMGFMLLFPNLRLGMLFLPISFKAKYFIGFMTVYEIYSLFERNPNDDVAHLAHLGGALIAFILIKYVWKLRRIH